VVQPLRAIAFVVHDSRAGFAVQRCAGNIPEIIYDKIIRVKSQLLLISSNLRLRLLLVSRRCGFETKRSGQEQKSAVTF
jgi:hypothetical protein